MLEEGIRRVEQGLDPMNVFRDPAKNQYIEFQTMQNPRFMQGGAVRQRGGAATKYSPVLISREGEVKYR